MAEIDVHPLAIEEARAARRRYLRVSQALAARFITALDASQKVPKNDGSGRSQQKRWRESTVLYGAGSKFGET